MPISPGTKWSGLGIFAEPLVPDDPEDRIRAAMGIQRGRLPEVGRESLQAYYQYLSANLSFPFQAQYPQPLGLHGEIIRPVIVLGLFDPTKNLGYESLGLVCKARQGKQTVELSLADLEVKEGHPNHEMIEDYWYWFWNWR
jgi:hypothetical protein